VSALRVSVAGVKLPRWLAEALERLEDEGAILVQRAERADSAAPGGQGRASALDVLLARRFAPDDASAWDEVETRFAARDGLPDIEVGCRGAARASAGVPLWTLQFGPGGAPLLEIELEARGADGERSTIAHTRTRATSSRHLSRCQAGWKAAGLLERALRARAAGTALASTAPASAAELHERTPRGLVGRQLARACERALCPGAWRLAWRARAGQDALPETKSWRPEHELVAPRGRYYADPFLLEHQGGEALFFEDFDERSGRGAIACVELDLQGRPGPPRTVLAAAHHLSYPFVFEHEGAAFMIPEMHTERRVELWRAVLFPWRWERAAVLLEGLRAVDTTWFAHAGRYWLMACVAGEHGPLSEELHAFWSDAPFGPWHAHAANPIVDDPRGARPAGRPFVLGGRLVRPAQDGLPEYGSRILFQEVQVLDPERYAERTLGSFEAGWLAGADGTHTYDRSARHEVVDARRPRWRLPLAGWKSR
jgi:hypothetical protein